MKKLFKIVFYPEGPKFRDFEDDGDVMQVVSREYGGLGEGTSIVVAAIPEAEYEKVRKYFDEKNSS